MADIIEGWIIGACFLGIILFIIAIIGFVVTALKEDLFVCVAVLVGPFLAYKLLMWLRWLPILT